MKILYIGDSNPDSTSRHRADALRRLGHEVKLVDAYRASGRALANRYFNYFHFRTGFRYLQACMLRWLNSLALTPGCCDLIWVDSGEFFGPSCLQQLRKLAVPVVLYNLDDPTGTRDGKRFDSLKKAASLYDLCVVVRDFNILEFKALGARQVIHVFRSYDEVVHKPPALSREKLAHYASDVCFIGTWMPERGPVLARLLELGIPLSIWGDRWTKAPEWPTLKKTWRGTTLHATEYTVAVAASKIAIGLLSKGNRDLHTQRSLEIPHIGGLLCGERTSEHNQLYQDGMEAVFWSDADECGRKCHELLANAQQREAIRAAGQQKIKALKLGNEDICRQILSAAGNLSRKAG